MLPEPYLKFLDEEEYVKSFTDRGEVVPPFLCMQTYATKDGRPGYIVPCSEDDSDRITEDNPIDPKWQTLYEQVLLDLLLEKGVTDG